MFVALVNFFLGTYNAGNVEYSVRIEYDVGKFRESLDCRIRFLFAFQMQLDSKIDLPVSGSYNSD